ncbi:uncharacterized protein HKW66_Vig0232030 [Vigna angularis]|uniref:Uncharacterized protein n=1 Tax=Phaseolus angularis TaxID=3914 RepID=A0A8T0KAT7_PHAAN|nr:uncharacterized protein HKW66_Vig0232030 [Vigna angularis]
MTTLEEARADASELRKDLGEKESLVESLKKELTALKKVKAEGEVMVRDLERKIGVLETKENEERNKRIRFEEEMRDKVDEKEKEINGFKQKLVELEKDFGVLYTIRMLKIGDVGDFCLAKMSLGLQVICAQNHTWETLDWKNHSLRIQNLMHSLILALLDLMDT